MILILRSVASVRSTQHVVDAALMGADVVILPSKILAALYKHPLTDNGLAAFLDDWQETGQSILPIMAIRTPPSTPTDADIMAFLAGQPDKLATLLANHPNSFMSCRSRHTSGRTEKNRADDGKETADNILNLNPSWPPAPGPKPKNQ